MAEIRVEERKRGAPWIIIVLLLIVAAVIGWWLWSNRAVGEATTGTPVTPATDSPAVSAPAGTPADTASRTP